VSVANYKIGKRMAAKLKEIKAKLHERMHESTAGTLKWLQSCNPMKWGVCPLIYIRDGPTVSR